MAYTSFRPTDNRTNTGYSVRDGKIIATDSNYCVEQLKNSRNPTVKNGRIFSAQTDTTCAVVSELLKYSHYDFSDIPELAFLGKKGNGIFKTGSGSSWNIFQPIRTSMPISSDGKKGVGKLTGKFEDREVDGGVESMVEVSHDFGTDMIFEQFISQ